MKCLPASKLPQANGVALHDWHAEVLAMRAFNHFVLEECRRLAASDEYTSDFLSRRSDADISEQADGHPQTSHPFIWRQDVTLHMYCSEAPCTHISLPP